MLIPLVLCAIAAPGPKSLASLAGDYLPDFSRASTKYLDVLKTALPGALELDSGGDFDFPASRQDGFWRVENGKAVLVYSGFFNAAYARPDAVLKSSWPNGVAEGMILTIQPDGSLELPEFGRSGGPIFFRKAPRIDTLKLVKMNRSDDEADEMRSLYILIREAPSRWKELLAIANNPKIDPQDRRWALISIQPPAGVAAGRALIADYDTFNVEGLKPEVARRIKADFAFVIARFGDSALTKWLVDNADRCKFSRYGVTEAVILSNYRGGLDWVLEAAKSSSDEDHEEMCKAIAHLGAKSALPVARSFENAAHAPTRVEAWGAVLKLSDDPKEQAEAITHLAPETKDEADFASMLAIDALVESRSKLAVAPLIETMEHGDTELDKERATRGLGTLGFKDALPALRETAAGPKDATPKGQKPTEAQLSALIQGAIQNSGLRKAAVQAIWDIEHPKTGSRSR